MPQATSRPSARPRNATRCKHARAQCAAASPSGVARRRVRQSRAVAPTRDRPKTAAPLDHRAWRLAPTSRPPRPGSNASAKVVETTASPGRKRASEHTPPTLLRVVRSGRLMGTVGDDRNRAKGVAAGRREASGAASAACSAPGKEGGLRGRFRRCPGRRGRDSPGREGMSRPAVRCSELRRSDRAGRCLRSDTAHDVHVGARPFPDSRDSVSCP
jgi:hypothetical protein